MSKMSKHSGLYPDPLLDHMEKYLSSSPLSAGFIMKWESSAERSQMGENCHFDFYLILALMTF